MTRLASLFLVLSLAACDKGGTGVPASPTGDGGSAKEPAGMKAPPAPATIPQKYVEMLEQNWPRIEELGATFEEQFKKAQESRGRDSAAVNAANETFQELADMWAEITYAAQDDGEKIDALWSNYLRSYEKQVQAWQKKNKALKEFSTVK